MQIYINKKEIEALTFILSEFINLHIDSYDIHKDDIDLAKSILNKIEK